MGSDKPRFRSIDPTALPKHFDAPEAERRWDRVWEEQGTYRYDPTRPREETFVVDTPPPTVSGSLHIGHVFSYTHTDVLARYKRMTGLNVFYPMGWDDNGLPTERRVQNYFHVRCDPHAHYEENLEIESATAKQRKKPPRLVSRPNFIDLCHRVTRRGREGLRGAVAPPGALGRLEPAVRDDRPPLPPHRPAELPRSLREGARLQRRRAHRLGRRLPDRGRAGGDGRPREARRLPPHRVRRRGLRSRLRDRHHAPRAPARVRGRDRPSRGFSLPGPVREERRDAALPRSGSDLPERAGGPREGNGHPHGLHLRRRRRTSSGGASRGSRCASSSAATER